MDFISSARAAKIGQCGRGLQARLWCPNGFPRLWDRKELGMNGLNQINMFISLGSCYYARDFFSFTKILMEVEKTDYKIKKKKENDVN